MIKSWNEWLWLTANCTWKEKYEMIESNHSKYIYWMILIWENLNGINARLWKKVCAHSGWVKVCVWVCVCECVCEWTASKSGAFSSQCLSAWRAKDERKLWRHDLAPFLRCHWLKVRWPPYTHLPVRLVTCRMACMKYGACVQVEVIYNDGIICYS